MFVLVNERKITLKVKKLLSLILALAMTFALTAPAYAVSAETSAHVHEATSASQDGIAPRVTTLPCCGATEYNAIYRWDVTHGKCGRCVFGYSGCNDNYATKYIGQKCTACGTVNYITRTESGYYCPSVRNYKY